MQNLAVDFFKEEARIRRNFAEDNLQQKYLSTVHSLINSPSALTNISTVKSVTDIQHTDN